MQLFAPIVAAFALLAFSTVAKSGEETKSIDELYAAAVAEGGKLIMYHGGDTPTQQNGLQQAFSERFPGINFTLIVDYSKYHDVRVDNQLETDTLVPDLVALQTLQDFPRWASAGDLLKYKPANFSKIHESLRDTDGAWMAYKLFTFGYIYNSSALDGLAAPTSPTDLVDPQWAGKIVSSYPNDDDAVLFLYTRYVKTYGWDWVAKMAAQSINFNRGTNVAGSLVKSGEKVVGVGTSGSSSPIKFVGGNGTEYLSWGQRVGILSKAKHPAAAKLFMNWVISEEAQTSVVTPSVRTDTNTNKPWDIPEANMAEFPKFMEDRATAEEWRQTFTLYIGEVQGKPCHFNLVARRLLEQSPKVRRIIQQNLSIDFAFQRPQSFPIPQLVKRSTLILLFRVTMVKPLSLLLLPVLALAQQQTGSNDVLLTMDVTIDGSLKNLQLLKGESFEDAAMSFARSNGLMAATDDAQVRAVIDQLSGLLKDKMQEVEAAQQQQTQPNDPLPSVQLSIPLTIDGYSGDLLKYETETPEAAVERFLYASGFSMDVMREVYPQLVTLVNQKLEELQPPKKELFAFALSLDGREITVRHFEGGIPMDEAVETLRGIGVHDGEFMDRVAPQIANQIVNEINNRQPAPEQQQDQQVQEPPVTQQTPQRRELFSEPLTLNNRPAVMVHYEGSTARETAVRFLGENGITDDATIESMMPQLVGIVDGRMAAILEQEAQSQAQATAEQQQQQRQPLVTVPINFDDQRQANLDYFEGDDVEATVQRFLVGVGLGESEGFNNNVMQLSALLRERIAAIPQQQETQETTDSVQPTRPEPLFSIPVTLSGNVYNLEYFEGQEPYYVANSFCVEKHEIVRAELGVEFDGDQLLACQNVLLQSILKILEERQQPQAGEQQSGESAVESPAQPDTPVQAKSKAPAQAEAETPADPRGLLLFTLDIDMGDGTSIKLPVHRNDNPQELASAFCTHHKLDQENVPALVDAMESQLKEL
ncbi:hypothetical protein JG688_00004400 [Phytophthora aleatoria]|uniref:Uncharacterized protein n=1 Tax=Phytophthora aleatoria TaxID=2496075 RepID=A0A8J5MBD5_9STRA|nr:hypothetical protein JG688_00004400 [Phytophthora aleatoria]